MNSSSRKSARHSLEVLSSATLQAWVIVLCVAATLSLLRIAQIAWHWPSGFEASWSDLVTVLFQGARFDLKVSAAAVVLLMPLLFIVPSRNHGWIGGTITVLFVFASLVNLHYFGFYKTPIDAIVFGFFEDDTKAIIQTIWSDFPVVLTLGALLAFSVATILARKRLFERLSRRLNPQLPVWATLLVVLVAMFMLVFTIKGTLRAMALGRQNVSVTTSQFLNDMVPNGVIALTFAWDSRRTATDMSDPLLGLRQLGFSSPMEAARELGIKADTPEEVRQALMVKEPEQAGKRKKNLLFFLMESWSAEPFLYQANDFDVLGRLAPTLSKACHFTNFDSAQPGTHPTLEAILFSSPITPLTLGPLGKRPIPWSIPLVLKRAGYHTLFVTSAPSGWRDLDRVLKTQGFDEIIDANDLKKAYPDAVVGIWGVWDSYIFRYVAERLKKQEGDKPLFVFAFSSTNHPPYDLPPDYKRQQRNMEKWGGERDFDTLSANLDTYHYATDLLGGFVQEVQSGPLGSSTVIAASGDHNARSFGLYGSPERRYLAGQVPFIFWGDAVDCGTQRELPASHRDMFPTLLPLVGVSGGYVNTGRNLLANPDTQAYPALNAPRILRYYGTARNAKGIWKLGDPASFGCTPSGKEVAATCRFDAKDDAQERARLGLLDWNVRSGLSRQ